MRPWVVALLAKWVGPWAEWVVPNYVTMLVIASLIGGLLIMHEARALGYERRTIATVLMTAYAGGMTGAMAIPLLQAMPRLIAEGTLRLPTGLTAFGGLLGGVGAGVLVLRRQSLPVLPFLDAAAPALGAGYFLSRIGCFLAGCDYGVLSNLPWSVRFPEGSHAFRDHLAQGLLSPDAHVSLAVHPTQLYLSLTGLLLYLVLRLIPASRTGRRFAFYVGGYAVLRFLIEFLRGDSNRGFVGPLSTSQTIAAGTLAILIGFVVFRIRKSRKALARALR